MTSIFLPNFSRSRPTTYPSLAKKPDPGIVDWMLGWVLNSKEMTNMKLANRAHAPNLAVRLPHTSFLVVVMGLAAE